MIFDYFPRKPVSLIAGSTFALFTSRSETNIAVTAGKVAVEANIADLTLYSVKANPTNGTIVDEYGYKYDYEKQNSTFINGGTAVLVGNELTLDKVTPGDKVRQSAIVMIEDNKTFFFILRFLLNYFIEA